MKKTLSLRLLAVLMLATIGGAQAQPLSSYSFSAGITPFQTIAATDGVNTITWGSSDADDGVRQISMPFSFAFGDSTIAAGSTVRINANGYLQFGGMLNIGSAASNLYTISNHQYKGIVPYINGDGYCNGNIYWITSTTTDGRQVLVVEYRGITTYAARTSTTEAMNYQIRIYADGTIEVHFDECTFTGVGSVHTLIMANTYADRVCLTGTWDDPEMGTPNTLPSINDVPEAGMCYTFSRPQGYCNKPTSIATADITAHSVSVNWVDEAATLHTVYWGVQGSTTWDDSAQVTGVSTYTITNLMANTEYRIAVRSHCSEDNASTLIETTAQTECVAIEYDEMPYIIDFEQVQSNADFVECWVRWYKGYNGQLSTGYGNYQSNIIYTTGADNTTSGQQSMRLAVTPQINSGVDRQWCLVALPEFEQPITDLQLTFSHKNSRSQGGTIEVGLMSNRADTATFTPIDTIAVADTWDTASITFADYALPEGNFIALRYYTTDASNSGTTYYCYIDDVTVLYTPSCSRPQAVQIDTVGTDFVTFTITDPEQGNYHLTLIGGGDTIDDYFHTLQYTVYDLHSATEYTLHVSKVCDNGALTIRHTLNFSTKCSPLTHEQLPYDEPFSTYDFYVGAPINPCWTLLNFNGTQRYPYPTASNNHSGSNSGALYFLAVGDSGQYASMPEVDYISDLAVTFFTYSSNGRAMVDVGVMTDPLDTSTFTLVYTAAPQEPTSYSAQWEEHVVRFDTYDGEGRYITFRSRSTMPISQAILIDDVHLDVAIACPHPLSVSVDSATTSTLSISIDDTATVGDYHVWVMSDADTVELDISSSTYTIDNLQEATRYTIAVGTNCADGSTTSTVQTAAHTLCSPLDADQLPWSENFADAEATVNADFPTCWRAYYGTDDEQLSTYAKVYIGTDLDVGHKALRMTSQHQWSTGCQYSTVALPQFDANPRLLELTFAMRFAFQYQHVGEAIEVGVMSNPADVNSFVPCATIANPGNYAYHTYTVRFGQYAGTEGVVAIRYRYDVANDNAYIYIDSLALTLLDSEAEACTVSGLALASCTDSSASLTWQYNCTATNYEVRIARSSSINSTVYTTANTNYTASDLDENTAYTVSVRAVDSNGIRTAWCTPLDFSTLQSGVPVDPIDPVDPDTTGHSTDPDTTGHATDTTDTTDTTAFIGTVVEASAFTISPNPATDVVVISTAQPAVVELIDATGHIVIRTRSNRIDVGRLPRGIYFVRIGSEVRKLVLR